MAVQQVIPYGNPNYEAPGIYTKKGGYLLRDRTGKPLAPVGYRNTPSADVNVQAAYQAALRQYNAQQQQAAAAVENARVQGSITSLAQRFAGKPSVQPIAQDNIAGPTSAGGSPARANPGNTQVQPGSISNVMRRRGRRSVFGGAIEASDALGA